MPTVHFLVGVPASGKSTWLAAHPQTGAVVSSDAHVEAEAARRGLTYDQVFSETVQAANAKVLAEAKAALKRGKDLVWDQTNLTRKVRAERLRLVPPGYTKVAVFFPTPSPKTLAARLASRPGKTIPAEVVAGMAATLEKPSKREGFDRVQTLKKKKKGSALRRGSARSGTYRRRA
jgi:predicted kinase